MGETLVNGNHRCCEVRRENGAEGEARSVHISISRWDVALGEKLRFVG